MGPGQGVHQVQAQCWTHEMQQIQAGTEGEPGQSPFGGSLSPVEAG